MKNRNNNNLLVLLFSLIFCINSCAKVLIITSAYNNTDLIELQYISMKKFILDDFEYVIFNDDDNEDRAQKIELECTRLGIRHERVPQNIIHKNYFKGWPYWGEAFDLKKDNAFKAMIRQGQVLQYAWEKIGIYHDDIVIIIDLDIFPIKFVNIKEYLGKNTGSFYCVGPIDDVIDKKIFGLPDTYALYAIAPDFMVFNAKNLKNKHLINLNGGFIGSQFADPGIFFYIYLWTQDISTKRQSRINIETFASYTEEQLNIIGFNDKQIKALKTVSSALKTVRDDCMAVNVIDHCFINYLTSSNWAGFTEDIMNAKTKAFTELIHTLVNA